MIYSKEHQTRKNRVDKPKVNHKRGGISQKRRGAISPSVRAEVKARSRGVCEVRKRCNGSVGVHMAHLQSRNSIDATTPDMLLHSCVECHLYLDTTPEGIKYKRLLRDRDVG